jgi:prepilin-type N-terminal cleavage/methylation domain-containing protein
MQTSANPQHSYRSTRSGRFRPGLRARAEGGFTLVEVLVVSVLLAVVTIPIFNALDFSQQAVPKNVEYAHAIADATSGLQRMMQEIRQAYKISSTNGDATTGVGSYIDFFAVLNDQNNEVRYDCSQPYPSGTGNPNASSYRRCVRVSCPSSGVGVACTLPSFSTGAVVIDRVLNTSGTVFTFFDRNGAPNPEPGDIVSVTAKIPVTSRGPLNSGLNHPITLDNGTSIPNLQNGS